MHNTKRNAKVPSLFDIKIKILKIKIVKFAVSGWFGWHLTKN